MLISAADVPQLQSTMISVDLPSSSPSPLEFLACGSSGIVYRTDVGGRPAAVKVLRVRGPEERNRFAKEVSHFSLGVLVVYSPSSLRI